MAFLALADMRVKDVVRDLREAIRFIERIPVSDARGVILRELQVALDLASRGLERIDQLIKHEDD